MNKSRLIALISALFLVAVVVLSTQVNGNSKGSVNLFKRRRANFLQELCELSPARRDRADVADELTRRFGRGRKRFARRWPRSRCRRGTPIRNTAIGRTIDDCRRRKLIRLSRGSTAARRKVIQRTCLQHRNSQAAGRSASPIWCFRCQSSSRFPPKARSRISISPCRPTSKRTAIFKRSRLARAISRSCITS